MFNSQRDQYQTVSYMWHEPWESTNCKQTRGGLPGYILTIAFDQKNKFPAKKSCSLPVLKK